MSQKPKKLAIITTTPDTPKSASKKAIVIAMLKAESGATIAELQKATGWQPHSVRGVISSQLRKKMGLLITSTKGTYGTVYRIETAGH